MMCQVLMASLVMLASFGPRVIENKSAQPSRERNVISATFQSNFDPMSSTTSNENDEEHAPPTNRQTTNSRLINIQENISTDSNSSYTEEHVTEGINTTGTTGLGDRYSMIGNGVTRMRTQYNGYLRQTDYEYYTPIVDSIRCGLYIIVTPLLMLTVVAFCRDKKASMSCKFVVSINAFDLASSMFNLVVSIMKFSIGSTHKWFVVWIIASNYCIVCCRRVVYLLNLLLAAQKLFAVVRPIQARYTLFNKVEHVFLVGMPLFVFVYHIYLALMYNVKEVAPMVFVQASTDIYMNNQGLFDNFGHFSKVVFSYVPLAITLGINCALLGFLRQHNEKMKDIRVTTLDAERSRKDRQMTLMIVISTLAYTVLSLPANINQMISSVFDYYDLNGQERYLFSLVKNAVNAAHTLGSLSNFVTYMSLSSGFRQHVMKTLLLFTRVV